MHIYIMNWTCTFYNDMYYVLFLYIYIFFHVYQLHVFKRQMDHLLFFFLSHTIHVNIYMLAAFSHCSEHTDPASCHELSDRV